MVKRRPSIDPSPSYSHHAAGDDARARMRHQTLLQDYQDLIKEADATKKRILKAKQKKLKLSAEVKFLRRKLKSFAGSHSLEVPLKLKKESYRVAIPSPEFEQMHNSGLPSVAHLDNSSHEITEAATQGTSALSHLNQVSNRPASPTLKYTQMQMLNSGLPSNDFSVDRNYKVAEAAARGITAGLDLNQASNRPMSMSMSYAHIHNSDLPPKAPPVDRNHKVAKAATLKTTALSDSNQVSYRVAIPSPEFEQMHNSGLPSVAHLDNRSHEITEAATQGTRALSHLNQVSNRPASPTLRYTQMQMLNSGLPSNEFSVDRNYKVAEAAARGITAGLDLNQASNRSMSLSMSYAHIHNSDLPPKAPPVDRNHKVAKAATLKTTALSDSNQVSYRPVPSSSRYSHMLDSGLPPKAPRNHKVTEAATRVDTALFDLNEVSYRAAPPTARYAQMNSSGLPIKDYTVVGNYKVAEAATQGTSTLLDLNQDAENFEEQESPRTDNLKRFSAGGSATMNDHKQMLHRVGGNDRNQLPLRV